MATKTVDRTASPAQISTGPVTLTANTADTVTFNKDVDTVEVVADSANTAYCFVRYDGSAATTAGTFALPMPPGSVRTISLPNGVNSFSIISSAASVYYATTLDDVQTKRA